MILKVLEEEGSTEADLNLWFYPQVMEYDNDDEENDDIWAGTREYVGAEERRRIDLQYPGWETNPHYQMLIAMEQEQTRREYTNIWPG